MANIDSTGPANGVAIVDEVDDQDGSMEVVALGMNEPISAGAARAARETSDRRLVKQLEGLLEHEPEDARVRMMLRDLLMRTGRWNEADHHIDRALTSLPDDRWALRLGAEIAKHLGDQERADELRQHLDGVLADLRTSSTLDGFLDERGNGSLLVRTDFRDDGAWTSIVDQLTATAGQLFVVDDRRFVDLGPAELAALEGEIPYYVFALDSSSAGSEPTVLVVDRHLDPGRWFRVGLDDVHGVEVNLSLANMDFSDFADAADDDHVFRGFG